MKKIFFLTEKNEKDAIAFSIMSPRYMKVQWTLHYICLKKNYMKVQC